MRSLLEDVPDRPVHEIRAAKVGIVLPGAPNLATDPAAARAAARIGRTQRFDAHRSIHNQNLAGFRTVGRGQAKP
jgi:hypothetical protein